MVTSDIPVAPHGYDFEDWSFKCYTYSSLMIWFRSAVSA